MESLGACAPRDKFTHQTYVLMIGNKYIFKFKDIHKFGVHL